MSAHALVVSASSERFLELPSDVHLEIELRLDDASRLFLSLTSRALRRYYKRGSLAIEPKLSYYIAENGFLLLAKWLVAMAFAFDNTFLELAVDHGQDELVLWALEESKIPFTQPLVDTIAYISKSGNFDLVRAISNSRALKVAKFPDSMLVDAATYGDTDFFEWGRSKTKRISNSITTAAAKAGKFDMLKYLKRTVPMNSKVVENAARYWSPPSVPAFLLKSFPD